MKSWLKGALIVGLLPVGVGHAEIVGSATISQFAYADPSHPVQISNQANVTDYDNPVSLTYKYVTGSGGVFLEHTTTSDSTLVYHQDLDAGLITGSLSWNLTGDSASHATETLNAQFELDRPYHYELTVSATQSAGPATYPGYGPYNVSFAGRTSSGGSSGMTILHPDWGSYGPLQLASQGTIFPGSASDLYFSFAANACRIEGCSNQLNSGSMQFDLRLTPVPITATVWLLLSGLGIVGFRGRAAISI